MLDTFVGKGGIMRIRTWGSVFCWMLLADVGLSQSPAPPAKIPSAPATAGLSSELIFPLRSEHNHAPGIVECPNGDLLVSWYRGSGERTADDVAVYGARLTHNPAKQAASNHSLPQWSEAFLMADRRDFPDCNTCMMVDQQGRLWLFWPTVIANSWESCLTNFRVSKDFLGPGAPKWEQEGLILLKPDDFSVEGLELLAAAVEQIGASMSDRLQQEVGRIRERLGNKLYQRLGWQPRCKPTVLPSGRILLPLYTDTFSISIMAVSDDGGQSWYASKPLFGLGNIQPAVLRRDDGTLVAYMRENGALKRIRVCESKDDGISWGHVGVCDLLNPGSGLDGVRLQNGHWLLVYNDSISGRNSLAVSLSEDEGQTWKFTNHLESQLAGSYHYPAVIQAGDGTIHVVYSYFVEGGKSMKHAAFKEDWVRSAQ